MLENKKTKVKFTFLVILVGISAMFTAVVTDHWAVLSPRVEQLNDTCEAAHFGLWRLCKKTIYIEEEEAMGKGCGPISLPGERNCSYFKHFNPGEDAEVFEVKTQKDHTSLPISAWDSRTSIFHSFVIFRSAVLMLNIRLIEYNISAAAISIFSLAFMILGTLCLLCAFGKGKDYLLKPAGMFFTFAGVCVIISVEVMRQSVKRMIESEDTIWIEYYYSWSFACACSAFVLLFLSGIALLVISMPQIPRNPWETCMDAEPEAVE